jgi:hypothetical protein
MKWLFGDKPANVSHRFFSQEAYYGEACGRLKKCDADDDQSSSKIRSYVLTKREQLLIENAYRRGFYQGFHECFVAVKQGKTIKRMEKHLFEKLHNWRFDRHGGDFKQPPEI